MANTNQTSYKFQVASWLAFLALGAGSLSFAATTDLASSPLASTSTSVVRANILFTLDDSGSMGWAYLPDYAGGGGGGTKNHCKVSNTCGTGETPYHANEYNGMAYNPRTTYRVPVNGDGTFKASQGSPWTAVEIDGYGVASTGTINLVSNYPEALYACSSGCPAGWTNKKNGVDTNNPFSLRPSVAADNPPLYAYPGTLITVGGVASNVHDGVLSQPTTASGTIYNGKLNVSYTGYTDRNLTGETTTRVGTTPTVSVSYTATSPALATGDTVTISGCSSGFESGGNSRPITVIDATHFTYVSNSGTGWSDATCSIRATKPSYTAVAPKVSKSGSIVTVTLSAAPTPALATGNMVTVTDGSGTCDAGYKAASTPMTQVSSTVFTYSVGAALGMATDSTCNITQTSTVAPASPGIKLSGTTVTVYKTAHGLVTGDQVQVSLGTSGVCSNGFLTSTEVSITRVDANTFTYAPPVGSVTTSSDCKIDKMTAGGTATYDFKTTVNANPYYFVILPTEYCDSIYLTNCRAATAPVTVSGVTYSYPAPVRFCKDAATSALAPGNAGAQLSGTTVNCQAKFSVGTGMNFQYARYGLFYRGDIVPTTSTYGDVTFTGNVDASGVTLSYNNALVIDRSGRADCAAAPDCTYAEEMTNFANWYAYYRTRMQMMKSAAGHAFTTIGSDYRVGFVTINEDSAAEFLPVQQFTATHKTNWYTTFYAAATGGGTPLREALSHAGRYFAGRQPGILTGDPMEYACQQNFEILTTDGYWNGTSTDVKKIDGITTMDNQDNVDSGYSTRGVGAYDGGVTGASNTLADVAMYYYKTDLRTGTFGSTVTGTLNNCTGALGTDVCVNIVPTSTTDTLSTQHMNTFSLGLIDGLMTYQDDYPTASTGDFSKIKTSATGCQFSGAGTCNWPLPAADSQSALDDLWHASVNGRGTYYNARDPESLSKGLTSALTGIKVKKAAAAASATSSPNITQTDRSIFSSTYRTSVWDGEVLAQLIDPGTGNVETAILWSAQSQLDTLVSAATTTQITTRNIYTFDAGGSPKLRKDFLYTNLTTDEQAYFSNKCVSTVLSQCPGTLNTTETASANNGENMVNYLRGDKSNEGNVYRARAHTLGDTVNAKPAYVRLPQYSFNDAGYSAFKTAQTLRPGMLYMGSNDGMLHAFDSSTGTEVWAYLPVMVMPNLYKLADTAYASKHQYYVDGSPEIMDIYVPTATTNVTAGWHTILVGGLGLGGRGFYALDVTDPEDPKMLWEICSDSTLCDISDVDIGYSYGNPVIVKRSTDGKWVVLITSGYNNTTPGTGEGVMFMLDAVTGAILKKTSTGTATNPPSGLAKLSPLIDSIATNYTARFVYGGDLNGNVWRFDLGAVGATGDPTVTKIATLKDGSSVAQSITTRVELADPLNNTTNSLVASGNPALFVGTGRYLGTTDLPNVQIQSIYGVKDDLSRTCAAASCYGSPRAYNTASTDKFVRQYIYEASGTTRTTSTNTMDWSANTGWYMDLMVSDSGTNAPVLPSPSPGERINLDLQLVSGTLLAVTNVPETSACTVGGSSWFYSLDYLNGQYISTATDQVAGTKLGNALSVGFVVGRLPSGQIKGWVTGADGEKMKVDPETKGTGSTRRTSWRELTVP